MRCKNSRSIVQKGKRLRLDEGWSSKASFPLLRRTSANAVSDEMLDHSTVRPFDRWTGLTPSVSPITSGSRKSDAGSQVPSGRRDGSGHLVSVRRFATVLSDQGCLEPRSEIRPPDLSVRRLQVLISRGGRRAVQTVGAPQHRGVAAQPSCKVNDNGGAVAPP